jgi:hypothetical protein
MKKELASLISEGRLKPGTVLFHSGPRYKVVAKVDRDGLEVNGRTFFSPSTAAKAVTGYAVNGWFFWRVQPSREPLEQLRNRVN